MAIIVDPDNLDRNQVVYNTRAQKLSLRDVGTAITSSLTRRVEGNAQSGSREFTDAGINFTAENVQPGQILVIFSELDAGHYTISAVNSATSLSCSADSPDFTAFSGSGNVTYSVHSASGGTIVDGVTEQAVYSFTKEEWRVDSELFANDNLIRHPFPFEAVTREQMEIGGGANHANWSWFNEYTRKKVRTGGWADKNTATTTLQEWTGVITLGTLDADAQVYYQPLSASANPVDFTFAGAINEAINTYNSASTFDTRSYLKIFVRKKGKSYAQATIGDIGVTSIETIVNRFPLAHIDDPAITAGDAEILGTAPFRAPSTVTTAADGAHGASVATFSSAGATFQTAGVQAGDTLRLTSGLEQGYYTIADTISEVSLSLATDFEFSTFTNDETALAYTVYTTDLIRSRSSDGTVQGLSDTVGTFTSSLGGFGAAGVATGDFLHIIEDGDIVTGIYEITSQSADNIITVDTTDRPFPLVSSGSVNFKITNPGMYLQYKNDILLTSSYGTDVTFTASTRQVSRSLGSWGGDGITTGSNIVVSNTTSNNGSFTVLSNVNDNVIQLVVGDVLVDETATTPYIYGVNAFKRTINGVTYGLSWKVSGNGATLANIFQFVQHQLRQTTDIDHAVSSSRGDVTDLLMSFTSPNATTFDMYIDDLAAADTNNVTYTDFTGATRTEKFVAAGTIAFNENLQGDATAVYAMFFTNDNAGDDLGRDYGTPDAITVRDNSNAEITGSVSAAASVAFTFDYDGNTQRGAGSAATDAPVTIVAIGTTTAQFVLTTGLIERTKTNNFSLVAALERNYSNPA